MKNLYFYFLVLSCLSNCLEMYAQQLPIFTQYRANRGYINPASIDLDAHKSEYNIVAGISHRTQWAGLRNGPTTQTLYGSYRTQNDYGLNYLIGGHLINDKAGKISFTGFFPRVAFLFSNDPDWWGFSAGFTPGLIQHRLDLIGVDNIPASINKQSQVYFDMGIGGFFYVSPGQNHNYFFAGASLPQIFSPDLTLRKNDGTHSLERIRHFYGQVGYYLDLKDDFSFIEFSSWVKYVPGIPIHYDLSFRIQVGKPFWFGGGGALSPNFKPEVKGFNGLHFEIGTNIVWDDSTIKFGYSFDDLFSEFAQFKNTHEFNITILLDK